MSWRLWLLAAFGVVAVGVLLAGGLFLGWLATPVGTEANSARVVEIAPGAPASRVARDLERAGVITRAWLFERWLRWSGAARELKAGRYEFSGPVRPIDVVRDLVAGRVATESVTLPEGSTLFETARLLAERGIAPEEDLLARFFDPSPISDLAPAATSLEGYLFPETYRWARGVDAGAVAERMVATFRERFAEPYADAVEHSPFTLHELVTLASLVEKETARPEERALIAGVYVSRLARGMRLQCDPTIIYARRLAGTWDGNIRRADLSWDHPYNTYVHAGLPPGPIASPGLDALLAALEPARTRALYFVARGDGTHVFSETYQEHARAVERFQKRRRRRRRVSRRSAVRSCRFRGS